MNVLHSVAAITLLLTALQAPTAEDFQPTLLSFTNEVADAAGLDRLANEDLSARRSELRVWIGFGVVTPDYMLRLHTNEKGQINGEVLFHFPSDLAYMEDDADEFRREMSQKCTNFRGGGDTEVCTATFNRERNWDRLFHKLMDLGISTLPDESELPEPDIRVHDGIAMVVEFRVGSRYRAYQYGNPAFRNEPEAQAADTIMCIIGNFLREANET